jgi:hypothetical protein
MKRPLAGRIGCGMRTISFIILAATPALAVDFVREVRPIFEKHCYECHGAEKQKNDYRLDIKAVALKNIVAGKSTESPLFRFVSGLEKDAPMPPKSKLSSGEIETLRRWIDEGANWPDGVDVAKLEDKTDWWAFKPLKVSSSAKATAGSRDETLNLKLETDRLDTFIRAKLSEVGLKPAPRADARTLVRRLFFDLTGLPPTPSDMSDWSNLTDERYEKLVDTLLASPRYGERWARHWLDLVHYGETHGYDKDKPRMNAWPYRDYVIRAFNNDKPYASLHRRADRWRCALFRHHGRHHGARIHRGGAVGLHRPRRGAGDEAGWQDRATPGPR